MRTRDRSFSMTVAEVVERSREDAEFAEDVQDLFVRMLIDDMPLCEVIWFDFWLDHVPITLREQLIRHRIGMKPDAGKFGVDVVPERENSTFWSQTMRVMDMGSFYDEGRWMVPASISNDRAAAEEYNQAMMHAQRSYRILRGLGIPEEDARGVIPVHATHGMAWSCNLQALKYVLSKRSCWIAQLGLWQPVITGITRELTEKVDPIFRLLATPPCMRGDLWLGCKFHEENIRRIDGRDHMHPPCSLYFHHHEDEAAAAAGKPKDPKKSWEVVYDEAEGGIEGFNGPADQVHAYHDRREQYGDFWGRNPDTGQLVQLTL